MKTGLALCALSIGLTSTIAVGQQVSVNYNHSQSFSGVSHVCMGFQQCQQGPEFDPGSSAQYRISTPHCKARGWQKAQEGQNPDVLVTANGGMKQQTSYSAWGMRGIGGGMGGITPEQNVIGTLVVDLYDAKNQSLIWRGIAQNTLNNNGNKNQQMVQKAVTKMFKQWPKT